jgi:hypothetical protein
MQGLAETLFSKPVSLDDWRLDSGAIDARDRAWRLRRQAAQLKKRDLPLFTGADNKALDNVEVQKWWRKAHHDQDTRAQFIKALRGIIKQVAGGK